jgi:hypothetical protein
LNSTVYSAARAVVARIDVLEPDREPDQVLADARFDERIGTHLLVRGRGRVDDQ